jgi:hypothetical protein
MPALMAKRQRGAATLIIVMVLFFLVSMVAAYTSRNMIFEQRTGANLYRSTQSLEAAEAGMEWALMMLNSGRIDDQCLASANLSNSSFRQRYLDINAGTGIIAGRTQTGGGELTPTCVFDRATGRWDCSCPVDGPPSLTAPAGPEAAPAFRVRMRTPLPMDNGGIQSGLVSISVVGCTRLDDDCLRINGASLVNEGRTVLSSIAMIGGRAVAFPVAALTARGNVVGNGMTVANARAGDSGITVHASGSVAGVTDVTTAGSAPGTTFRANDVGLALPALAPFSAAERFFAATFMLPPQRWVQIPGVVTLTCGLAGCSAQEVRDAIEANPGSALWLTGGLSVNSTGDIGSAAAPALIVVNGNLSFSTPGVTLHGLVMVRPADPVVGWVPGGDGRIVGAVIVDGAVNGAAGLTVENDGALLATLRSTAGSFVRVPTSWRDWNLP